MSDIEARARAYAADFPDNDYWRPYDNSETKQSGFIDGCKIAKVSYLAGARAECSHLTEELARMKQECAELRNEIQSKRARIPDNCVVQKVDVHIQQLQQAKEAGALSMAEMIIDQDAREFGYGETTIKETVTELMTVWREAKHE